MSSVVAAEKIEKVVVTGMGVNESKAIKSATKAAIQQVVGMYVVSDAVMKNRKLIKDEVLTQSNAYVKSFKTLNKSVDEDGLFELEAEVEVEVGKLTSTLGKLNLAMKNVSTDEFKAVTLTNFSSTKDFKAMLHKVVFEPLYENKKVYSINVDSFKVLEDDVNPTLIDESDDYVSGEKSLIENAEMLPFELSFSFELDSNYLNSMLSFFDHASKQSSDTYIKNKSALTIYKTKKNISKVVDYYKVFEPYKSYLFTNRNAKIIKSEAKKFIEKKQFIIKVSLLDQNNESVKDAYYSTRWLAENKRRASRTEIFTKQNYGEGSYKKRVCHLQVTGEKSYARDNNLLSGVILTEWGGFPMRILVNNLKLITNIYLTEDEVEQVSKVKITAQWQEK